MPLSLSGSLSKLRRLGRKPKASPTEPNTTAAASSHGSLSVMFKNVIISTFDQNKSGEIISLSDESHLSCVSPHICRQCQLIFHHLPPLSSSTRAVKVKHHANKTILEQSTTTCSLCYLFILAFNLIEPDYGYEFYGKPGVVYIQVFPTIEGRSWRVKWCYPPDEDDGHGTRGCSIVIDPTRDVGKLHPSFCVLSNNFQIYRSRFPTSQRLREMDYLWPKAG